MYCSECSSNLGVSDKFCSKCGAAIPAIHQQPVQEAPLIKSVRAVGRANQRAAQHIGASALGFAVLCPTLYLSFRGG